MIWKTKEAANNNTKGTTAVSNIFNFFLELNEDALMSTLSDRTTTKRRDIRTPAMPPVKAPTKDSTFDDTETPIAMIMTNHNYDIGAI